MLILHQQHCCTAQRQLHLQVRRSLTQWIWRWNRSKVIFKITSSSTFCAHIDSGRELIGMLFIQTSLLWGGEIMCLFESGQSVFLNTETCVRLQIGGNKMIFGIDKKQQQLYSKHLCLDEDGFNCPAEPIFLDNKSHMLEMLSASCYDTWKNQVAVTCVVSHAHTHTYIHTHRYTCVCLGCIILSLKQCLADAFCVQMLHFEVVWLLQKKKKSNNNQAFLINCPLGALVSDIPPKHTIYSYSQLLNITSNQLKSDLIFLKLSTTRSVHYRKIQLFDLSGLSGYLTWLWISIKIKWSHQYTCTKWPPSPITTSSGIVDKKSGIGSYLDSKEPSYWLASARPAGKTVFLQEKKDRKENRSKLSYCVRVCCPAKTAVVIPSM